VKISTGIWGGGYITPPSFTAVRARIGGVYTGRWRLVWWGEAGGERSGCDRFRRVRFGTAVQVRTGKVFTGRVRSGWAVHDGKGFNRSGGVESGTARQGSLGRVRAGLLVRQEVCIGVERFGEVVVTSGEAVMDGQCVDVLGPVRYEEAVEEFNG
jgi:hypothetical protein